MYPIITELPYQKGTILDIFASLANQPWSMLLHSGQKNNLNSRFDIFVTAPVITLVTNNGVTKISKCKKFYYDYNDPFLLLKQQLKLFNIKTNINYDLPFQGGALGWFGYDLIRYIENIPIIAKKDIDFPDMAVGLYRWTIISDNKLNKLTLITHDDPAPVLMLLDRIKISPVCHHRAVFQLQGKWQANMTRVEYGKKFRFIKQYIQAGDCYQVCLSQRFHASYQGDTWSIFYYLSYFNQMPFSAFIKLKNQTICSFSPERFLSLHNGNITAQPIKGTIQKSKNDFEQIYHLKHSVKNQAENLMIVDVLRNDIGRVALFGSVKVPKLFNIITFPTLHHMVSTINAQIAKNYSACDLLRACFPSASVTGAPKIRAMKIIEQLEPQRRSVWCGSIGYLSFCGGMDTNIAIRTLLITNNQIFCSAGSGIIFDSDEEEEYQEIAIKLSTLLPPLNNFFV